MPEVEGVKYRAIIDTWAEIFLRFIKFDQQNKLKINSQKM